MDMGMADSTPDTMSFVFLRRSFTYLWPYNIDPYLGMGTVVSKVCRGSGPQ